MRKVLLNCKKFLMTRTGECPQYNETYYDYEPVGGETIELIKNFTHEQLIEGLLGTEDFKDLKLMKTNYRDDLSFQYTNYQEQTFLVDCIVEHEFDAPDEYGEFNAHVHPLFRNILDGLVRRY